MFLVESHNDSETKFQNYAEAERCHCREKSLVLKITQPQHFLKA